jgi:hypothetical protein
MASADRSQTAIVVGKAYDLVLWLLPKVERFPGLIALVSATEW